MNVFITGASSGIGKALAIEYAKRYPNYLKIGLLGRQEDKLKALKIQLKTQYGAEANVNVADVRDTQIIANIAKAHIAKYGTPDIVIANAGVSVGTLTEFPEDIDAFKMVMETNVIGMANTFQPFILTMKQQASNQYSKQLVGIASVAGIRGLPGAGAYSASKAATITYLESLRIEMAHHGIDVTTIAPGYIRTPMTDVNTYPMPFIMDVDVAASRFVDAIQQKKRFTIIPWQMRYVATVMKCIPPVLWDKLMFRAPHKKRKL